MCFVLEGVPSQSDCHHLNLSPVCDIGGQHILCLTFMGLRLSVLCPAVSLKKEVEPAVQNQCFLKKKGVDNTQNNVQNLW